jgi:hypothetical protein
MERLGYTGNCEICSLSPGYPEKVSDTVKNVIIGSVSSRYPGKVSDTLE